MPDSKREKKKKPGEILEARKKHKSKQKVHDSVKRVLQELETKETAVFCLRGRKFLVSSVSKPTLETTRFSIMKKKSTYYVVYEGRNSNECVDVDSGNILYDHGTDKKPQVIMNIERIIEDNKRGLLSGYINKQ